MPAAVVGSLAYLDVGRPQNRAEPYVPNHTFSFSRFARIIRVRYECLKCTRQRPCLDLSGLCRLHSRRSGLKITARNSVRSAASCAILGKRTIAISIAAFLLMMTTLQPPLRNRNQGASPPSSAAQAGAKLNCICTGGKSQLLSKPPLKCRCLSFLLDFGARQQQVLPSVRRPDRPTGQLLVWP